MASNINPNQIDGTFPVAGQDNDSQGFRNNFTNIGNNLGIAASEISDLQSKAILSAPLTTVPGSGTNNLAGASISNFTIKQAGYALNNLGTVPTSATLDISTGNVQEITTGGSITIAFASTWPTVGKYASMILWLNVASTAHTVTVPVTNPGVTLGLSSIVGANSATGVISFNQVGTYVFEFSTIDGGNNIEIRDLARNYNNIQGNLTVNGGYINTNYLYLLTTTGSTVNANVMYNNYYIDSTNSATISSQTINIPYGVEDGRTLNISALCPITTTTFTGGNIKYVSSNYFSAGNVNLKLQYNLSGNVWFRN